MPVDLSAPYMCMCTTAAKPPSLSKQKQAQEQNKQRAFSRGVAEKKKACCMGGARRMITHNAFGLKLMTCCSLLPPQLRHLFCPVRLSGSPTPPNHHDFPSLKLRYTHSHPAYTFLHSTFSSARPKQGKKSGEGKDARRARERKRKRDSG